MIMVITKAAITNLFWLIICDIEAHFTNARSIVIVEESTIWYYAWHK